jgi:hypothetical protein
MGGDSMGGNAAVECVDVCELYGPACCVWSEACVETGGNCVIDVLSGWVDTTYDYDTLEQRIAAKPQEVLASVTDADVASIAMERAPASRIEMQLTARASSMLGILFESAPRRPFRVSCGGQSLFLGVFYEVHGAAAIRTPVMHVSRDAANLVILRLGAWQGAWIGLGTAQDVAARTRIDRTELRAVFCGRGVLRELALEASP